MSYLIRKYNNNQIIAIHLLSSCYYVYNDGLVV